MTVSGPDPFSTYDAAYVLGGLSPEDRAAFEQHLRECDNCSRSVREFAGLPGLLSQVDPVVLPEPPADLLPSLLTAARRARRRRTLGVIADIGIAVAAGVTLMLALLPGDNGLDTTEMTPLGAFPVQASAGMEEEARGSRVDLSCSYRGGGDVGDYVLVAVRRDGTTESLATWRAVPDDTARISVGTALHRGDVQALEIRTVSGVPLMRWNP
ncbi:anti-sigma factor family protein [Amycolatopsis nigrescens]|uniref:anti-sigma factor family protein n=1 Tax=Amycolatopsis nigrescens TaxID=381445 RepID=UPI0003822203|nr:zf-HC2 domain-containing protein [Amycolatopsis nigrescens]